MKISEEKEYIYSMMRDITAERRQLTEMYLNLSKRLEILNNYQEFGLDVLDSSGFSNEGGISESTVLETLSGNRTVENEPVGVPALVVEPSKEHATPVVEDVVPIESNWSNEKTLKESMVALESLKESRKRAPSKKTNDTKKPVRDIATLKADRTRNKQNNRKSGLSTEMAVGIIEGIMKETNEVMKPTDIHAKLVEQTKFEVSKNNFTVNILPRVLKKTNKIEKVGFGEYRYKSEDDNPDDTPIA